MSTNNKALSPNYIVGGAGSTAKYGVVSGSMAASVTSAVVPTAEFDNIAIQAVWSAGSSPVGTITVQASLDYGDPISLGGSANWTTITLPSTAAVSGNSGSIIIDLNQISFPWIRVVYTRTSGSGTLAVAVSGKGV